MARITEEMSPTQSNILIYFSNISEIPSFLIDSNVNAISQIRHEVMKEWDHHFDPLDRSKIEDSDNMILRFFLDVCEKEGSGLKENAAISKTVKGILSTLNWRKEVGINRINIVNIPEECFLMTPCPYIGQDGRMYLLLERRYQYLNQKVLDAIKIECLALYEREYEKLAGTVPNSVVTLKPCLIIDFRGVTISQENPVVGFKNRFLMNHFPGMVYESIVVGFPDWITSFARMSLKLIPKHLAERVSFMTIDQLINRIGMDNIPVSLGGMEEIPKRTEEGRPMMEEFLRMKRVPEKDICGFLDHWKRIKEWDKANDVINC